jgi:DedD protein
MGLMSLFRRLSAIAEEAPKGKRAVRQQAADHEATVQKLRQQARRRLIGAAVLLGIGVVAFPVVFETQPRPVPMDLPIVIPHKADAETSLRNPPEAPPVPASLPPDVELQEPTEPALASEPTPPPAHKADPLPKPAVKPAPVSAEAGRFVVQVGAFADSRSAQEVRRKLEAKGLKTYTQVANTKDGDRIRVRLGPFADRSEADKAAAQAKSIGLVGSVLAL